MLSRNDAYAVARAFAGLPDYQGLVPGLLAQTIIDNYRTFQASEGSRDAYVQALRTSFGGDIIGRIFKENPTSTPPETLKDEWRLYTPDELAEFPETEWLLDKVIYARAVNVLYGASGLGKSFFALHVALQVAQNASVVYIAGEGQAGYAKRVYAWCKHYKQGYGKLVILPKTVRLLEDGAKERLVDLVQPHKPALVVIDTVGRAMVGYDENLTKDMALFTDACDYLKERGELAVWLIHHTNKGGDMRGNGSLFNNTDLVMRMSGDDDLVKIEWEKTKDDEKPYPVHLKPITVEVEIKGQAKSSLVFLPAEQVEITASKLSGSQIKVLDALEIGITDTDDIISSIRVSRASVYRILGDLVKIGLVHKQEDKSYTITEEGKAALERIHKKAPLAETQPPPGTPSAPETPVHQQAFIEEQRPNQYTEGL